MSQIDDLYETVIKEAKVFADSAEGNSNDAEIDAGHEMATSFEALDASMKDGYPLPSAWWGRSSTTTKKHSELQHGDVILGERGGRCTVYEVRAVPGGLSVETEHGFLSLDPDESSEILTNA